MMFPVAQPVNAPVSASTDRATHLAAGLITPAAFSLGRPETKQACGPGGPGAAGSYLPRSHSRGYRLG